jgi:hypothetical protein
MIELANRRLTIMMGIANFKVGVLHRGTTGQEV